MYNRVTETNNTIDSKIQNMLTVTLALIPFILGVIYYVPKKDGWTSSPLSTVAFMSVSVGVTFFFLTVITGAWNYKPLEFSLLISPRFIDKHKAEKLVDIKEVAVATLAEIVETNRAIVNGKANRYKRMIAFFILGAIAFSIGFLFLFATAL